MASVYVERKGMELAYISSFDSRKVVVAEMLGRVSSLMGCF